MRRSVLLMSILACAGIWLGSSPAFAESCSVTLRNVAGETIVGPTEQFDNDESCTITATLNPSGSTPSQERNPRKIVLGEATLGAALLIGGLAAFLILSRKGRMEPRSAAGWVVLGTIFIWSWAVLRMNFELWLIGLAAFFMLGHMLAHKIHMEPISIASWVVLGTIWIWTWAVPRTSFVWLGGLIPMGALLVTLMIIEVATLKKRGDRIRMFTFATLDFLLLLFLLLLVWGKASEGIFRR